MNADRVGAEHHSNPSPGTSPETVHATCVAIEARAVLIRGASGAGKSSLALQMIALGAELVSDDRTLLWRDGDTVMADAPAPIRGQIEARGVGILRVPAVGPCAVRLVIDLDCSEEMRLPPLRETDALGSSLPLLRKCTGPHFPAAVTLYLRGGVLE